jgi:uncharacterized protein YjiS (DUF1127 family)
MPIKNSIHSSKQQTSATRLLITLLNTWRVRVRDRRALAPMSERSLKDIGITRYDVLNEIRKPFWRA